MWAALPAGARRVHVGADRELAALLAAAGYELVDDPRAPADVAVLAGGARVPAGLTPGALVAVPAPAGGGDADAGRAARLAAGADLRPLLHALRAQRALRRAGLRVWRLETGAPQRRHRIRTVTGARPPRPGRRPIVLGSAAPAQSALDASLAAAAEVSGMDLRVTGVHVLAGGALMAEVEASAGGPHLLRLAGGPAAELVARGADVQRELLAAEGIPDDVRARLLLPVAQGEVGPLLWTLEPRAPGGHPGSLDRALRDDCMSFLTGLRRVPVPHASYNPAADAGALAPHLDGRRGATLQRVAARLAERLAEVALGWGHGDFWTANLLVGPTGLGTVLDWDSGGPAHLPMLDLMHLLAHADPDLRRRSHGARCVDRLWPAARAGGDPMTARYASLTDTPSDAETLEALAVAYWLTRAARDVQTFADRARRPRWMAANVLGPLVAIEGEGW